MYDSLHIQCPWCGESVRIALDAGQGEASFVEDCPVCCSPMLLHLAATADGRVTLERVEREA